MANECSISVIDLHDFPDLTSKLMAACEEWGCFKLLNHHIPSTLMSAMKLVIKELFDLPVEIKLRNLDVITTSGYMVPTEINPLYDSLGVYDMASRRGIETFFAQLDASPH
ncbi:hypothetical protein L6452_10221 [Arctium lappa]|uniref:Uncharacterized protein n=1 Tax=Arctium lappa TaxID=4217 RepID=A0ACB9DN64_ARCLA|nr:hypothetical protein L6452_10221 [Arctium lappa]